MEDIIALPQALDLKESALVQLYNYQISEPHVRNRINLTHNTFSFLIDGTKEVMANHDPIFIDNSKFLIIKSGHCLMTENLSSANNIYRSVLLFFSDKILLEFVDKHGISAGKNAFTHSVKVGVYDSFIGSFVKSLDDIRALNPSVQAKLLEVKFEEIMLYLVETRGTDFLSFLITEPDDHSRNLIKVVESNRLNKLTVKELAFLSHMSISTFKREFEKQFQQSPIKWFQDKRLEYSAFLMRNKSKRPSEIYEEIGYETLSNFIQAFKTKFGTTPKQYQLGE